MAPRGGKETDVSHLAGNPSLFARAKEAAGYLLSGARPSAWMSPGTPLKPFAPEGTPPRGHDYPINFNTNVRPRQHAGVSFERLRALADSCDLLRLVIETRKDQLEKLDWQIKPREDGTAVEGDKRIQEITTFFMSPDKENDWCNWLRMILEDLFVLDAVAISRRRDRAGRLYSLDLLDGATIAVKIDESGRRPLPPETAYQQVLKGAPAIDFTSDELIYARRNPRTSGPYGRSPVEQIIMTVNIAIMRATRQLGHYTDGNMADGVFWLPPEWSVDAVKSFQTWWDGIHDGNQSQRRKAKFLPGNRDSFQAIVEPPLKDQFDEWLARVICFCFSISPQPFIQQMNRATAETAHQAALEEGLAPIQKWIKGRMDRIVAEDFGSPDLEFAWVDDREIDPKVAAEIQNIKLSNATLTINEARAQDGRDPYSGVGDLPGQITAAGFVPLPTEEDIAAAKEAERLAAEALAAPPEEDDDKPVTKAHRVKKKSTSNLKTATARDARDTIRNQLAPLLQNIGIHVAAQLRGIHAMGKAEETDEEREEREKAEAERFVLQLNLSELRTLNAIEPAIRDVVKEAAQTAVSDLASSQLRTALFNQVNTRASNWAQARAADLVTQIDDTTRTMLRESIEKGLKETDIGGIADTIQKNYAFSERRARLIAETEVATANGQGALKGYQAAAELGLKVKKEWLDHEGACPTCATNAAAGPIELNQPFPGGVMTTPQHPACECTTCATVEE